MVNLFFAKEVNTKYLDLHVDVLRILNLVLEYIVY
jgi:hypothetical protein